MHERPSPRYNNDIKRINMYQFCILYFKIIILIEMSIIFMFTICMISTICRFAISLSIKIKIVSSYLILSEEPVLSGVQGYSIRYFSSAALRLLVAGTLQNRTLMRCRARVNEQSLLLATWLSPEWM